MEEIAKKTDLPENKIQSVIAKVHKANKAAVEKAKAAVELPAEDPTRQSERLKEQTPEEKGCAFQISQTHQGREER